MLISHCTPLAVLSGMLRGTYIPVSMTHSRWLALCPKGAVTTKVATCLLSQAYLPGNEPGHQCLRPLRSLLTFYRLTVSVPIETLTTTTPPPSAIRKSTPANTTVCCSCYIYYTVRPCSFGGSTTILAGLATMPIVSSSRRRKGGIWLRLPCLPSPP